MEVKYEKQEQFQLLARDGLCVTAHNEITLMCNVYKSMI